MNSAAVDNESVMQFATRTGRIAIIVAACCIYANAPIGRCAIGVIASFAGHLATLAASRAAIGYWAPFVDAPLPPLRAEILRALSAVCCGSAFGFFLGALAAAIRLIF